MTSRVGAAAIVHRLRRRAERGEGIDDGAFADRRDAGDINVGDEANAVFSSTCGPITQYGPISTPSPMRAPSATRAVASIAIYSSVRYAPSSASAISAPPTFASPRYHHMLRRCAILST